MCLGIPGRITEIWDDRGTRMALVDFGGATRTACLAYLPDASIGEYTIVHAGFALTVVDEAAAHRTLATFRELGLLAEELGPDPLPATPLQSTPLPAEEGGR
ncbi:HypC/HybG/HupF family hydrogenase formation chaperone [Frankia sp. AgPm24]|uniref:HypC/HybG/HupF family hydrogenase formation chaperone n=1 Tax=Frankia umida TaxID=573489 RepID=A0ABT0K492_9ACTN|nr:MULTISPECIES: HypC/HybG/HupF family hydrogenase formation chaperone [Frankia]MCK9878626.1 HypC/HybG/HupF family hydrogenase formation chaperone [Frankia umida]MCK9921789.1 HypC/HybG/HupF family hydrogenase formation chaperone [Frankia sp. AgPm24]